MNLLEHVKELLPVSIQFDVKWNDRLLQSFYTHTNISDWSITVEINPDIKARVDDNRLCSLIYTLIKHEEGHWKICPFDGQYHLEIRASVITACKKILGNGITKQKAGDRLCGLVVNMFEDLVVDKISIISDDNYKNGMETTLGIINEEREKQDNLSKLILAIRKSFLLDEEASTDDVKEVLKTLCGDLSVKEIWPKKANQIAEKIFSIISPDISAGTFNTQEESDQGQSAAGDAPESCDEDSMDGESGSKQSSSSIVEEIQSAKARLTSESIQEKMLKEDDAYKESEIKEYYKRITEEAEKKGAIELSKGCSPLISETEALDIFFESKTEDLKLKYYERKATAFPITYLGKRKLYDNKPSSVSRIKWSATRIFKRGEDVSIDLYEKDTPINHESGQDIDNTFFDLALILDSSASMGSVYKRGSHSFVLVTAIYSLLRYLRETGKDIYMNYSVINFSSETWYSGWKGYRGLKGLKKKYILKQQAGGTELKPEAIEQMATESQGPFMSIMVTDGELENITAVVKAIQTLVSMGNEFCLIEIGDLGGELKAGVERAGGDTYTIKQVSDLSGLILKQGRKYWQST